MPKDHILQAINEAIDFSFSILWDSQNRQTIKEIEVNIAYRWFLGYGPVDSIPHFSTFGKN